MLKLTHTNCTTYSLYYWLLCARYKCANSISYAKAVAVQTQTTIKNLEIDVQHQCLFIATVCGCVSEDLVFLSSAVDNVCPLRYRGNHHVSYASHCAHAAPLTAGFPLKNAFITATLEDRVVVRIKPGNSRPQAFFSQVFLLYTLLYSVTSADSSHEQTSVFHIYWYNSTMHGDTFT